MVAHEFLLHAVDVLQFFPIAGHMVRGFFGVNRYIAGEFQNIHFLVSELVRGDVSHCFYYGPNFLQPP